MTKKAWCGKHLRLGLSEAPHLILWALVTHDPDLDRDLILITNVPIENKRVARTLYEQWQCRPQVEHTYRFDQEAWMWKTRLYAPWKGCGVSSSSASWRPSLSTISRRIGRAQRALAASAQRETRSCSRRRWVLYPCGWHQRRLRRCGCPRFCRSSSIPHERPDLRVITRYLRLTLGVVHAIVMV